MDRRDLLERAANGLEFDSDFITTLQEFMRAIHEAYPYKTAHVPKHLLDEFNKGRKEHVTQMHFTVSKDVELTDDDIRGFLSQVGEIRKNATPLIFGDKKWVHNPPHTGREKTDLANQ